MSMYVIQKNNVINIVRGDSVNISLPLYSDKFKREKISLSENDLIFFGLMLPRQHFECAFLKKEFDYTDFDSEGNLILALDPLDTMSLISGVYYYELKLLKDGEDSITTLIPKTKFIIND